MEYTKNQTDFNLMSRLNNKYVVREITEIRIRQGKKYLAVQVVFGKRS